MALEQWLILTLCSTTEFVLCTESVREACITHLVEAWLKTYNGDRLAVLALLDIENSADVCQSLLQVLFKKSTPLALTEDLTFLNDECVYLTCSQLQRFSCVKGLRTVCFNGWLSGMVTLWF